VAPAPRVDDYILMVKRRDLFGLAFQESPLGKGSNEERQDRELKSKLARLPLAVARADALAEIARSRLFRGTRGFLTDDETARLALLDPESRALFEKFRAVETNAIALSIAAVAPHAAVPEFVRIGSDSALGALYVTAGAPTLHFCAPKATPARDNAHAFPSVWHYLLFVRERGAP
jgi:hypothetical protein